LSKKGAGPRRLSRPSGALQRMLPCVLACSAACLALGAGCAAAQALAASVRPPSHAHGSPTPALQVALSVETDAAYSTGKTAAVVEGTVEGTAEGSAGQIEYHLAYGLADSQWCSTRGIQGMPQTTASARLTQEEVRAEVNGLAAGHEYCVELVAETNWARAHGQLLSFTAGGPGVGFPLTESLSASAVRIDAEARFAGQPAEYRVLYGVAKSSWCESEGLSGAPESSTPWAAPGAGELAEEAVEAEVVGLQGGVEYCAKLELKNEEAAASSESSFFVSGEPSAQALQARPDGADAELIEGSIGAAGEATSYEVEYEDADSAWCRSQGKEGAAHQHTEPASLPPGGGQPQAQTVTVEVGGLRSGSDYCAALVAKNASASSTSSQLDFAAGLPGTRALEGVPVSPQAAQLRGEIDPAGQHTTYWATYAEAQSATCTGKGDTDASTPPQSLEAEDESFHAVTVALPGLRAGIEYCVQLLASNAAGTTSPEEARRGEVYLIGGAPTALTESALASTSGAAVVTGQIDPAEGQTTYRLLYSSAGSRWCRSDGEVGNAQHASEPLVLAASDGDFHPVQVEVTGLQSGSGYCAAFTAENSFAEETSDVVDFNTTVVEAAPTVSSVQAAATAANTATLQAEVNPEGAPTTYSVEYGLASSQWCASAGVEGSPEHVGEAITLEAEDARNHPVAIELTGLRVATEYCATILASNANGPAPTPAPTSFTTPVLAPAVTLLAATATGQGAATLQGEVNPNGADTDYVGEYALAGSQWCRSGGADGSPEGQGGAATLVAGTSPDPVKIELMGLAAASAYCATISAENSTRIPVSAAPLSFTTEPLKPSVTNLNASATGASTAALGAEVNPGGGRTSYYAEYALGSSTWCQSGGTSGTPEQHSASEALASEGMQPSEVKVALSGLHSATAYCATITAENSGGAATPPSPASFATSATKPSVSTSIVSGASETSATLAGEVDPEGAQTTYMAGYGLASSKWCTSAGGEGAPEKTTQPTMLEGEGSQREGVQVPLTGLSAATEYCAAIMASNEEGAAAAAPVDFSTTSPSSNQGNGGVLGSIEESEPKDEPLPSLGSESVVGTTSGSVRVEKKGTDTYVPLTAGEAISDGSEIEAEEGRVHLTVALPNGKTQSAEAAGGRFRIEQEKSGFTKFVLTLPLTGCPRTSSSQRSGGAKGGKSKKRASARRASVQRSQPLTRHLLVAEKGGHWGTSGRYVSTSVEGTSWLTTDNCGSSIVKVLEGKVRVRNLVTGKIKVLSAGQSYTATDSRKAKPTRKRKRKH
jgi:hypothetical protein